ncbi:hypothetical protein AB0J68_01540, partial [Micromonospora sp. NPDC049580]|uniref:hypothetical protein n=1 Tax=Micromonospora sp. NPDC049580 TaxID=3154832 RepID=UPI00341C8CA9
MTDETVQLRRRMHRRGRRRAIVAVAATALIASAVTWWAASLGRQATAEQQRANTAVSGAEQLCQQVRQLGGTCVVDGLLQFIHAALGGGAARFSLVGAFLGPVD